MSIDQLIESDNQTLAEEATKAARRIRLSLAAKKEPMDTITDEIRQIGEQLKQAILSEMGKLHQGIKEELADFRCSLGEEDKPNG